MTFSEYYYDNDTSNANTRKKGSIGENRAVLYLRKQGYEIICRNYRSKKGEIDCIARDTEGVLVFVEVKSAYGKTCGNPASWVHPLKQRTLMKLARQYLAEHGSLFVPCRFDVITLSRTGIDHYKNAIIGM